jgi:tRNA-splicing ligase RtcB
MDAAMSIAPAVAGALMPDAHVGYGLPIGGVLALDNAVCPYAVGVDIACRMKSSIFEIVRGWECPTRGSASGHLPATCGDAM